MGDAGVADLQGIKGYIGTGAKGAADAVHRLRKQRRAFGNHLWAAEGVQHRVKAHLGQAG
ncbi:hypothetical protein D3C71_1676270 [compost metagenome]